MSEILAVHLVRESGWIKKTATKAALTRTLDVELMVNGEVQHRKFTVLENISHQIKDVFVNAATVLKLCDVRWDGISKEHALQTGPFKDFLLPHVSVNRLIVSDMRMVVSLQPRAWYTGVEAFQKLLPNLEVCPVTFIQDVMELFTHILENHVAAHRLGIQTADAGLHNFAFQDTFNDNGVERRLLCLDWENCEAVRSAVRKARRRKKRQRCYWQQHLQP